jgi:transposase
VIAPDRDAFVVTRSLPHGHAALAIGVARKIGLASILGPAGNACRDLVLAMIVARIIDPGSKLATAWALSPATATSSLGTTLDLGDVDEDELYTALDWLREHQPAIETALEKRHLKNGKLVLYDASSCYMKGHCCSLAHRGYSRDGGKGTLQIFYGLLCAPDGCPLCLSGWRAMLVVETIGRIRREHLVKGKSIKEIARDLKISRNTVRKILRSGETSFSYEREVQPRPRPDRWKADLDRLLTANAGTSARERLTLIRLFEELRALGYEGGYDSVRRYARTWSREHASQTAAAFVPLSFAPGDAYQFDWSHEIVVMNGVTVTVKVAHVRLCHSRMMFFRTYPRETQEMAFDAHERAFAFFRGACTRGIYDNMRHLRQREDGGGHDLHWQGSPV